MKPFMSQATDTDPGEMVNIIPKMDGSIKIIEANKNAVIVQLFISHTEEGERVINRAVCVECMDDELYPDLQAEALRILHT